MQLKALVGAGGQIGAFTMPIAAVGLVANLLWPSLFSMGLGRSGRLVGVGLLAIGAPVWLTSVFQILRFVPAGRLITTGPFAIVLHPLYTSVSLLVLPGLGLLLDSWLGLAVGALLYGSSRRFAPREEQELVERFKDAYAEYRRRVLLPWL